MELLDMNTIIAIGTMFALALFLTAITFRDLESFLIWLNVFSSFVVWIGLLPVYVVVLTFLSLIFLLLQKRSTGGGI